MTEEQTNIVCVGIDGGGTSTRLLAADAGNRRWRDKEGTSNPRKIGIERAGNVISGLIRRAIVQFPDSKEFRVCAGIAGAASSSMQQSLADQASLGLGERPAVSIQITDDATIAYEAAFAGDPGVLFLIGTGSNVLLRTVDGALVRSGGWGYLLGDEGSGYSIGREGMRAVAASIDAKRATALTRRAAADLNVSNRETFIEQAYRPDYSPASFAPTVLEEADSGDAQCLAIIDDEVMKLVSRLFALIELENLNVRGTVKTTGGLSGSRLYMSRLTSLIQEQSPTWQVARSEREPVEGALWMANRMANRMTNRITNRITNRSEN